MNVWLIGASSGLGKGALQALKERGHTVVAGARSLSEDEAARTLPVDVTSPVSAARFAETACRWAGAPDALVLAQGMLVLGAAEDISADEYRRVLDTNFFGTVHMVKAALPYMKQKKAGRIAVFSSVNGLLSTPFEGAYCASKHALEGWCECLSMELRRFGIQVMLVEPGDHRGGSRACRPEARARQSAYEASFARAAAAIRRDEDTGGTPEAFGRRLARALERKRLPVRLRVASPVQQLAVFLHDLLPSNLFLRLISAYYRV